MKKWVIPLLIGLLVGCVIGIVVGLFALDLLNITTKEDASYGVLEIVYYLVAPIGVLATFLAVAVALWGNEFKNRLFREKTISTVKNNFTEVLKDGDDSNFEAVRYDCNLEVKNSSDVREITDCTVSLLEIKYQENETTKEKKIPLTNRIPIFWKYPNNPKKTFIPDERASICLLKIYPAVSQSKADSSETTISPHHLSIVGCKSINQKYLLKGRWELTYCVGNSHRETERFKIIIRWSGNWQNRETEMNDEASIEMVRIKK